MLAAGVVISLEQGANDLHMVQLMPLPLHHLLLQVGSTFLVPAYPCCAGKEAVKLPSVTSQDSCGKGITQAHLDDWCVLCVCTAKMRLKETSNLAFMYYA